MASLVSHLPRVMAQDLAPSVRRYAEAAELREKLREAKERTDAALGRRSAQAEAVAPRCFRLGQRVTHAVHGYRGVICGRVAPLTANVKHALLCASYLHCLRVVGSAPDMQARFIFVAGKALSKGTNAGSILCMHSHGGGVQLDTLALQRVSSCWAVRMQVG